MGSTPQNQLCYVKQRKKQGKEGRLSFFWWEECYDPLQAHSVFTAKSALQRTPGVSGLGSLLFGDFFFLKQNNYLVLGLLSKCHLRGQSPERSPCLKKRHRAWETTLTCGYPAGACGASWTSRLSHPKKPVETVIQSKLHYFSGICSPASCHLIL